MSSPFKIKEMHSEFSYSEGFTIDFILLPLATS